MPGAELMAAPRRDGIAIAVAAFVVYIACARQAWHGIDMLALLNEMHRGSDWHPYYGLFPALLRALQVLTTPFGGGIYHAGLVASAGGTAIAVGCVHAAARRLGLPRSAALFAALVMATLPGVVYFAVIVEVHGHLLAVCGMVWVLMARWAVAPRPGRAVLVGLGLGLAGFAHPIAAAVGLAMVPMAALTSPSAPLRQRLLGCLLAFATLLLCLGLWLVVLPRLGLGGDPQARGGEVLERLTRFLRLARDSGNATLGSSLVREWLVPFFPASVVVVGLSAWRRSRAAALTTLVATTPFMLISWLILWVDECGAYVTMAAGPLALTLAAHLRSHRVRVGYLATAIAATTWFTTRLQVTPRAAATAAAVQAAVGDRAMAWLVGDGAGPDGQVWFTSFPRCHVVVLADLLSLPLAEAEATLARLAQDIAVRERDGVTTIVTSTTIDTLAMLAPVSEVARAIHGWLTTRSGAPLGEAGGVRVFAVRGG